MQFTNMLKRLSVIGALLVAMPFAGYAKPTNSFSGGFSSGKSSSSSSSSSKSSTPSAPPSKTSFGSFGSSKTPPADANSGSSTTGSLVQKSAMTQSLDKNTAQANALKTLDARTAAKAPVPTPVAPPTAYSSGQPINSVGQQQSPPVYSAPPPQVIYQNGGSSGMSPWTSGFLGFMLGRAMNHQDRPYYPPANNSNGYGSNGDPQNGNWDKSNAAVRSGTSDVNEPEKTSVGMHILRVLLWCAILGSIGGAIWYFLSRSGSAAGAANKRNYSL